MKQYCRYCINCVLVDDNVCYCECLKATFNGAKARNLNKCKNFHFNPFDVFNLEKQYKPRVKKQKIAEQITMFLEE